MKKMLKYIFITFFIIVVLLAAMVMAVVNFINPNDYRDKISSLASAAVHQPVSIHGDIGWQFLPVFGVVVHDISVGSASDAAPLTATLTSAHIGVQLWPLIHQRFEVERLDLDGLHIEKTLNTTTNTASAEVNATLAPAAVAQDNVANLSRIHLKQLRLNDVTILLHDKLNHVDSQITDLKVKADNVSLNASTPFELSFTYLADVQKNQPIEIQWQGTVINDSDTQRITAQDCRLTVKKTLPSQKSLTATTNIEAVYEWQNHRLTASSIEGNVDDFHYKAHVTASSLDQNPELQFAFDGQTTHLKELLSKFGVTLTTNKADVLQKAHLQATGAVHNQQLTLSPLQLDFDDSHIDGSVQTVLISNSSISANLHIDHIDVGAYLPPSPNGTPLQFTQVKAALKCLLPQGSQSLVLNGPISFGSANIHGLNIQQFSTLLDMKDQQIQLNASKAQLLSGQYQGNSQITMEPGNLKWSTTMAFSHIQIQPLLAVFNPNIPISGIGEFSGSFNSQGIDAKSHTQHLNGHAKLAVHNGVLHGINLQQWIDTAKALKANATLPQTPSNNSTAFGDLTADATIQNGIVRNDNLLLKAPFARAKGQGTIDLTRQQLDYHLNIDQITSLPANARFHLVPLVITGSFASPRIQIDLALLSQQLLAATVEQQKNRLAETIAKNTGNAQLGGIIQHMHINRLLGNA